MILEGFEVLPNLVNLEKNSLSMLFIDINVNIQKLDYITFEGIIRMLPDLAMMDLILPPWK